MAIKAIEMAGNETVVEFAIVDGWPANFQEIEAACMLRLQEMGITRIVKAVRFRAESLADLNGAARVHFGMIHAACVVHLMSDEDAAQLRAKQEFNAMAYQPLNSVT